jgi:hypothetical protein
MARAAGRIPLQCRAASNYFNFGHPKPATTTLVVPPGTIGKGTLMTLRLDWPSDVVDLLTEEARQKGLSLDDYLLQTVLEKKTSNGTVLSDEAAKRQAREEAGRSIRELRKGNILGSDLSIHDLIQEGRRF